jgi:hypothetical protein
MCRGPVLSRAGGGGLSGPRAPFEASPRAREIVRKGAGRISGRLTFRELRRFISG